MQTEKNTDHGLFQIYQVITISAADLLITMF